MGFYFKPVLNTWPIDPMDKGNFTSEPFLLELVRLRACQVLNQSFGELAHTLLLKNLGESDRKVAQVRYWQGSDFFDVRERLAFHLTDKICRDEPALQDALHCTCGIFTPGEVVRLVLVVESVRDSMFGSIIGFAGPDAFPTDQ